MDNPVWLSFENEKNRSVTAWQYIHAIVKNGDVSFKNEWISSLEQIMEVIPVHEC